MEEVNPTKQILKLGNTVLGFYRTNPSMYSYLLENSNLLNGYGPFIFGSHVGEYVWLDSDETKKKPYEVTYR